MKSVIVLILGALCGTALLGQSPEAPAQSPADKAFADIRTIASAPNTISNERARWEKASMAERMALVNAAGELQALMADKFLRDFPEDSRRWQVSGMLLGAQRDFRGEGAEERRAAWAKRRAEVRDALINAPDADEAMVGSILEREIYAVVGRRGFSDANQKPDLAKATELVELMASRAPGSDRRRFAERSYYELLNRTDAAKAEAFLRQRASQKEINPSLAAQSEAMLRIIEGKRSPLELKFTGLDGKKVDLADYRGKVVLIDFWATWCVPCMEEMPNVKRVYAKYRDQGFEIIGISLDAAPRDPANQRKHEKTAEQLKEFLVAENMTWPQHYDGKHWDNEYSRKYALGSIPATFLIGKDGRIFSTENHGEKLEANVQKALGI